VGTEGLKAKKVQENRMQPMAEIGHFPIYCMLNMPDGRIKHIHFYIAYFNLAILVSNSYNDSLS
jgi:hypothetical protein